MAIKILGEGQPDQVLDYCDLHGTFLGEISARLSRAMQLFSFIVNGLRYGIVYAGLETVYWNGIWPARFVAFSPPLLLAKSCEAAAALRPAIVSVNFNRQLGNLRLFFFAFFPLLFWGHDSTETTNKSRLNRPPSRQMFHLSLPANITDITDHLNCLIWTVWKSTAIADS